MKVAEDRDVVIPCAVTGKPKPSVKWYRGSQELIGDRYDIADNGNLVVKVRVNVFIH